jgi:hypothetical protein
MRPPIPAALLSFLLLAPAAFADGNVGVGVGTTKNGVISLSGDGGNNEVEIRYNATNGTLVIEGKNGTLVGGETTKEIPLPDGEIKAIVFSPGEGNDQVTVDLEGLPEGKRLEELEIEDVDQRDSGNDTVTVKNVSLKGRGRLKVGHDTGDDTTVIEGCDATNLNVSAGPDDDVTIRNCNASKRIKVDGTPDNLRIEDSFYPDLQMNGSTKPNGTVQPSRQTWIQRTTGKKVSYSGGSSDDEIAFEDNTIESVSVKLGDGNDLISFTGSTIEKVSIDGGPGALDCFDDTQDGNVFGSFKEKGFEDCDGPVALEYFGLGADPIDEPPQDAVAWRTNNPEIGHIDGPFALPDEPNPLALPVLDPLDVDPAHWADPDLCDWIHLHGSFESHDDPAPGPPSTESACGHGALEWGRLVPAN